MIANDNLDIVGPFVAAVRRQNVIILVGGIIVALLLAGISLAGVRSGRESAAAARSGAATAAAADRGAASAKASADIAASTAMDAKTAADGAAELTRVVNGILDPAGPNAQAQAAQRQQIIDGVTAATNRLAVLVGDNQQLSRSLAASESGRRTDAATSARQAAADRALLTELATRLAAVQAAVGRPSTPSTPTTTLPPPSAGLCALVPALAPVLGCR